MQHFKPVHVCNDNFALIIVTNIVKLDCNDNTVTNYVTSFVCLKYYLQHRLFKRFDVIFLLYQGETVKTVHRRFTSMSWCTQSLGSCTSGIPEAALLVCTGISQKFHKNRKFPLTCIKVILLLTKCNLQKNNPTTQIASIPYAVQY